MIPPVDQQPAYVLHRRAYRETSAIVELLTRDFGRVGAVVRGAKGSRGRTQNIEPFGEVAVTWRGRGQMVTVFRCESVTPRRLTGDLLFAGLYVNELLIKLLGREEPLSDLFHHYAKALDEMQSAHDIEPVLRTFERRLLDELGYGLAFDFDIHNGRPIDRAKTYRIVDGEGFCEVGGEPQGHPGAHGPSRLTVSGEHIAAMASGQYADRSVRQAAKQVLRRALALRLDGKVLTTRRLFAAQAAARA